ncbi:hypothetical protein [uncultured Cytophaga sp.]|uniref:hypothetical protein n=1 Tax=uncultured Cytophaga sp. TaxID=160238 RepID=UPI002615CB88|nr:hypothetical protein [uncultured Cytophaga sp.]
MDITLETIRTWAKQNTLSKELKYDDSFIISEDNKEEVEVLLKSSKIGYQGITQSENKVMFIIQPFDEQG